MLLTFINNSGTINNVYYQPLIKTHIRHVDIISYSSSSIQTNTKCTSETIQSC